MKRFIYLLLLSILSIPAYPQYKHRDIATRPATLQIIPDSRSLEAKFIADVTSGAAPLTVHFTDRSTGNPTTWQWDFGDGTNDSVQNPVHTYQQVGTYSVKLTISDGTLIYSLEKKDYIKVTVNYSGCDTLHHPLPEPLTYYVLLKNNVPRGYVSGNNYYGDKAIADLFDNTSPGTSIKGAIFEFSYAKLAALNSESLQVKAWKYDSINKCPGDLIGYTAVSLANIVSDVAALRPTQVIFDEPLQVNGPFFLGINLPELQGDTLALWTTKTGAIMQNSGWVMQSNNEWAPYDSLYTSPVTLRLTNAIYPIVCHTSNSVDDRTSSKNYIISPNPATDFVRIESKNATSRNTHFDLITATGEKVMTGILTSLPGSESINIGSCKPGLYFLRLSGASGTIVKRLIIR